MLGIERRTTPEADLVGWGGRDRAAKVAAAAATLGRCWERLDDTEFDRMSQALDDHARAYLEWMSDLHGPIVHDIRGILTTVITANTMLRNADDVDVCDRLAAMLRRAASNLVATVDAAGRVPSIQLP